MLGLEVVWMDLEGREKFRDVGLVFSKLFCNAHR